METMVTTFCSVSAQRSAALYENANEKAISDRVSRFDTHHLVDGNVKPYRCFKQLLDIDSLQQIPHAETFFKAMGSEHNLSTHTNSGIISHGGSCLTH